MTFGEKLYELRKAIGLSQEQLAERCGITRQSVSKWELGQGYPETEKLLVLCRVLNVDLDYLLRDEIANPSASSRHTIANPYQSYLGKLVTLLLHDRGFGVIPLAAITAMNDDYIVFEINGKKRTRKKGAIKIADIQAISEAKLSEKKAAAFGAVEIFDLKSGDNPYKLFIGKNCALKLKRSNYSRTIFSGDVYVDWLPSVEISAVTDENITMSLKNKEMFVRNGDVLTVIEN